MNTKFLMTLCAAFLAVMGMSLTFMPMEIADYLGIPATAPFQLFAQLLGALYCAFGMLNWMAKGSLIGGIYNRPIAVANFIHFLVAGISLTKGVLHQPALPSIVWLIKSVYILFAVFFGILLFRHPLPEKTGAFSLTKDIV